MGLLSKPLAPLILIVALTSGIPAQPQAPSLPDLLSSPETKWNAAPSPATNTFAQASLNNPAPAGPIGESRETIVSPESPTSQPYLHRIVKVGLGPQPLTGAQKMELAIRTPFSLGAFGSNLFGAGQRHLRNDRPHYGTDSAGFGERLGAAELKQSTDALFSYGIFAAALHEDPHYYVMGRGDGNSYTHRAVYSATRIVLTRKDDGNTGINLAKLAGMAGATALTNTYYPQRDRGAAATTAAYFSNLGISALSLELHEFLPDVMHAIHHKKNPTP